LQILIDQSGNEKKETEDLHSTVDSRLASPNAAPAQDEGAIDGEKSRSVSELA
jgi:hypothetical protein